MELQELIAREEIRDVMKRYARGIDRNDADLILSCYHPGAIDDHGMFTGPAEDFVTWVTGERLNRYVSTTHFLGDSNIVVDGDTAAVDTYCVAFHLALPDSSSSHRCHVLEVRYLDRFEHRGEWRIADRKCVFDWAVSQVLDGASLTFPEGVTRGRKDREDEWYLRMLR